MILTLSTNMVAVDCECMVGSDPDTCVTFIMPVGCIPSVAETESELAMHVDYSGLCDIEVTPSARSRNGDGDHQIR
jgi:hypothetical protein